MYGLLVPLLLVLQSSVTYAYGCQICAASPAAYTQYKIVPCPGTSNPTQTTNYNQVQSNKNGWGLFSMYRNHHHHWLLSKRNVPSCYTAEFVHQYNDYLFVKVNGLCSWVEKRLVKLNSYCHVTVHQVNTPLTTKAATPRHIPASITTTQPIVAPTNPVLQLMPCRKLDTITYLAHNQVIKTSGLGCADGQHGLSENVLLNLCNAPKSILWRPGYKVVDNCSKIPLYTAVAAFNNGAYNGVAGVLIECNSVEIKIATEECDGSAKVLHITNNARGNHNIHNFYTVMWN